MKIIIEYDPLAERGHAEKLADALNALVSFTVFAETREVRALNSARLRIAVLCRNRGEFLAWCAENPATAGKVWRSTGSSENAFPVTCEMDAEGCNAREVVKFGNWQKIPQLGSIEELLRVATCRGPVSAL